MFRPVGSPIHTWFGWSVVLNFVQEVSAEKVCEGAVIPQQLVVRAHFRDRPQGQDDNQVRLREVADAVRH